MCKTCFDKEYLSFPTQKDFEDFDLELTKKLKPDGLKYIGDDGTYLVFGYSIYQCQNCMTTWWLSQPDNSWRGYFAREKNAKLLLNETQLADKRKRQTGLFILTFIALVIAVAIFKTCG